MNKNNVPETLMGKAIAKAAIDKALQDQREAIKKIIKEHWPDEWDSIRDSCLIMIDEV